MQSHKNMWDLCGIWDFAIKSQIDTLKKPYKISTYEHGEMAERLNALVLKTSRPKGLVGSNPTPSAIAHKK